MGYNNRKHIITWTSPKGIKFELKNILNISYSFKHYGNLNTIADNKKLEEEKSNIDTSVGDIFEDLGVSGRLIPLNIVFNGENHDIDAEKFENAFKEIGESKLQLTFGNPIKVSAQSLSKSYNLVDDISSTVINIEFIEIKQNSPQLTSIDKKNILKDNIKNKSSLNSKYLNNSIKKMSIGEVQNFKYTFGAKLDTLQDMINKSNRGIVAVSNTINNIKTDDFTAILKDVQANLPNLSIGDTSLIIAQQISLLIDICFDVISSAPFNIMLLKNMISGFKNKEQSTKDELISNEFLINTIFLSSADHLLNIEIETKKESFNTAVNLQDCFDSYKLSFENDYNNLDLNLKESFIPTININNEIQNISGYLIENSLNLKTEFVLNLNYDTNIIDLAYKYYQNDFITNEEAIIQYIIKTNNLKDEELILIPKNKKMVLYV